VREAFSAIAAYESFVTVAADPFLDKGCERDILVGVTEI
jgi:hypothetical protein